MEWVQQSNFELNEYATAIAWIPDGSGFTVATADGEIVCFNESLNSPKSSLIREIGNLRERDEFSIDALTYSANGKYLAAAGQAGKLYIWNAGTLVTTLTHSGWINVLAWHPKRSLLAFGVGKIIHIWNAEMQTIESSLELSESSVLGLAWNSEGTCLLASGNQVIKCWQLQNWNAEPEVWELTAACGTIGWSTGDRFFAAGCFDRTVIVALELGSEDPWRMSGFPEKVSLVAWSSVINPETGASMLATVSGDGVVIWDWNGEGWDGDVIVSDGGRVNAIAWQPGRLGLAIGMEENVELRMLN